MRNRLQHLRRDDKGMTFIVVGAGMMAFLAATTLAIDVGMFMTARSQAQNSADAGALAGAVALGFDDFEDRSASGPAVEGAVNAALANAVVHDAVSVTPADVTFPLSPTGANNRVRVSVYRTAAKGNAVPTLIGAIFGVWSADVMATATAEAAPANAMTCVKPFIVPDRWLESSTGQLAVQGDEFAMYDRHGNPLPNPDTYIESGEAYTGYNNETDRGALLTLRAGPGTNISPTFYFSLAMGVTSGESNGGETGSDAYRWNIENCNTTIMHRGDIVIQEPGNVVGPTIQGAEGLIARDPDAHWDTSRNSVVSDLHPSPRVFPIPLYDPIHYADGVQNGRYASFRVSNWIGFFLESISGSEIYGRIIPIAGIADSNYPTPDEAFPIAIRLVE